MAVPDGMVPSRNVGRFAPLILLVLLGVLLYALGATRHLSLDGLREHRAALQQIVEANRWPALAAFMGVFAAVTAAFIPAALVLTLAGGFLFGPWLGGAATVVAATAGATVTCAAVRAAAGPWVLKRYERQTGRIKAVIDGVQENAFFYVLALRLFPLLPFSIVNVAVGLSRAPLGPYMLATLLGAIPTSLMYAHLGAGLGRALEGERSIAGAMLQDPKVLWALAGLAVLSLLPVLARGRFPGRAP